MQFLEHPFLQDPMNIAWAVAALFAVYVMVFWIKKVIKRKFENQLLQVVKNISVEYKADVYIPDGLGESVCVPFLMLTHYGIIVLNVQNYPGILFGGEKTDLWTQVFKGKSFKFENPLIYNRNCIQSVNQIISDSPVFGQVVFTQAGEFPKGKPEGVCLTFELLKYIEAHPRIDDLSHSLTKDWKKLTSVCKDRP